MRLQISPWCLEIKSLKWRMTVNYKCLAVIILFLQGSAIADTITYRCSYTKYSDGESVKRSKLFKMTFLIDLKKKKSYIIGNQGSAPVRVFVKQDGVSFVEVTKGNNVMVTAVDQAGNSVHSRQTILFGKVTPSQYYGACVVK